MLIPSPACTRSQTCDTLFDGKIRVVQEKDGYRFSLDAILLAGFVRLKSGERIIDLGTGIGIIPLILGKREEGAGEIVGMEIQEKLSELAKTNVSNNNLEGLIHICHGDIRGVADVFPPSSFDVVVTNPPYYRVSSGRINPSAQKAIARHEVMCTIDDVLQAATYLLKEGGRIFIIFPAYRSVTLFDSLRNAMLEPKTLRWVHSRANEDAKFILFIYADDGKYTPEMERLYSEAILS